MAQRDLPKELEQSIEHYWRAHRKAYENHLKGEFANNYDLHENVRQTAYRVVIAAEALLEEKK